MPTKKKTQGGTIAKVYDKAKDVVGTLLAGAAAGAVSGAAESAKKAAGVDDTAQPGVAGKGKGRTTKDTKAKSADAAHKAMTKPAKKTAASTKPKAKAAAAKKPATKTKR